MVNQKPKIIWIAVIVWIIIGILLSITAIYLITLELDYSKQLFEAQDLPTDVQQFKEYRILNILGLDTTFRLIGIIFAFLLVFGTYYAKRLARLGSFILSFYLLVGYTHGVCWDVINGSIGFTEYPYFNLYLTINEIMITILVVVILYIYLKPTVKNYFNMT